MAHGAMFLRPLELGFAALLVLTVGAKMAAYRPQDEGDRVLVAESVSALLSQRGFAIRTEPRSSGIVVTATNGECRMKVREYPPEGTYAATIAEQARPIGPLKFAYRGELISAPPKVRPLLATYVRRVEQRLGFSPWRAPILAIAAAPACNIDALPWDRLAALPR